MTDFVKELSEYAVIIKNLGKVKLSDGNNLAEKLNFGGVSFWGDLAAQTKPISPSPHFVFVVYLCNHILLIN